MNETKKESNFAKNRRRDKKEPVQRRKTNDEKKLNDHERREAIYVHDLNVISDKRTQMPHATKRERKAAMQASVLFASALMS